MTLRAHDHLRRRRLSVRRAAGIVVAAAAVGGVLASGPAAATPAPDEPTATGAPTTTDPAAGDTPAVTTTTTPDTADTTTTTPATAVTTTTTTTPDTTDTADTTTTTTTTTAPTTTTTTAPTTTLPPPPAPRRVLVVPEQVGHILATIRYVESRGDYTAPPNRGNASGAYQFIARTWDGYAGYPHAYLAPPEIQDERAALDVMRFLDMWDNDVSMIPVMWYYPRAATDPSLMDVVPVVSAGNVLTIREYQTRWLGVFSFLSGLPVPPTLTEAERRSRAGLPPELPTGEGDTTTIAFPVLGPSRVAAPACDADDESDSGASAREFRAAGLCAQQPPGIVFGVQLQPVVAIADGVVTAVHDEPASDEPISVTITDVTGRSYVHAGFNDDTPGTDDGAAPAHLRLSALARIGTTVRAGQILGFMGNSDPLPLGVRAEVPTDATVSIDPDVVAPHIRISITELDGSPVDAFGPLIDALFRQSCHVAIGPWAMPPNGRDHRAVTIETTDDDRTIDSEWVIGPTGRVTATGWAAMVNPHHGCPFAPPEPHGPGAAGSSEVPLTWLVPIDLPTSIWVRLAAGSDRQDRPAPVIRP